MYRHSLAPNFQQKLAFSAAALDLLETHQCSDLAPRVFSFFVGWLTVNIWVLVGWYFNNIAKVEVREKYLLECLLPLSSSSLNVELVSE